MKTKDKRRRDYGLSNDDIVRVKEYCLSDNADLTLIMKCACLAYNDREIQLKLFISMTQGRSYERLGHVPIDRNSFYGYRKKMIFELKKELLKIEKEC